MIFPITSISIFINLPPRNVSEIMGQITHGKQPRTSCTHRQWFTLLFSKSLTKKTTAKKERKKKEPLSLSSFPYSTFARM